MHLFELTSRHFNFIYLYKRMYSTHITNYYLLPISDNVYKPFPPSLRVSITAKLFKKGEKEEKEYVTYYPR